MAGVLVDTNILIYAHDPREPEKQKASLRLLDSLAEAGEGILSVQSLSEFYNVVTRKLKPRISPADAAKQVEQLANSWPVLNLTPSAVITAARGVRDHQLQFWDAQLWAVALLNQLNVIFSEDLNDRQTIEGIRIVNPFTPKFNLADWI